MKTAVIFTVMTMFALSHGCAEADFSGANARATKDQIIKKQPDPSTPDEVPPPNNVPPGTPETPIVSTDDGNKNKPACVRSKTAKPFSFSIDVHKDTVSGKRDPVREEDVSTSPVQRFNVSEISGDILPVSSFGLDDVAFIVKETDVFPSRGRVIDIPAHALVIKDGNHPNGASGYLDAKGVTYYRYKGQTVTIDTNKQYLHEALNRIAAMGIQPINHNQIKISDMKAKGFVDANGNVAFKVIHVTHGLGYLSMVYTLQPCD